MPSYGCDRRGVVGPTLNAFLSVSVAGLPPIPDRDFLKSVLDTTPADLAAAVDFSIMGPFTASRRVLDGMRSPGAGTMIFLNGGSAVRPQARYAGTSIAFAGRGRTRRSCTTPLPQKTSMSPS